MGLQGRLPRTVVLTLFFLGASTALCQAEEIEKKLRVALLVGGYNTAAKIPSESGNLLFLTDSQDRLTKLIEDPRDDSSVFNDLTIQTTQRATLSVSYGLTRFLVLEGSLGYQEGGVGNVEVQGVFRGTERLNPRDPYPFQTFLLRAGQLTQVPIQLTGMMRFRPKAVLNPYFGLGVGYVLVGFEPSEEFNNLSRNMDSSAGGQTSLSGEIFGFVIINPATTTSDLIGADIDARDTFEWHGVGGIEYTFRKKWGMVFEMRYTYTSRALRVGFNGAGEMGVSLPSGRFQETDPVALATYGPVDIVQGGLIDGGRLVPSAGAPAGFTEEQCATQPGQCEFDLGNLDGVPDPGFYYVHGGPIKYGGYSFQAGIRYTF